MKKILLMILFVILGASGGVAYTILQKPQVQVSQAPQPTVTVQPTETTVTENMPTVQTVAPSERYQEFTAEAFKKVPDKRRILFFYASWCPTCIPADADIRAHSDAIPEDTIIFRVNYNDPQTDQDERLLARKYGVTYQHTFVQVENDESVITRWNGGKLDEVLLNTK